MYGCYGYSYGYYNFDFDMFKPSSKSLFREFTENLTDTPDKPFLYENPIRKVIRRHRCRNPDKRN